MYDTKNSYCLLTAFERQVLRQLYLINSTPAEYSENFNILLKTKTEGEPYHNEDHLEKVSIFNQTCVCCTYIFTSFINF